MKQKLSLRAFILVTVCYLNTPLISAHEKLSPSMINAAMKVNLFIERAMSNRLNDVRRTSGLKSLEALCARHARELELFCKEEVWDISLFLQNRNEPNRLRLAAFDLHSMLVEKYPEKQSCKGIGVAKL